MTGSELKAIREQLGLTQNQLGRVLHRDKRSVQRWESGEVEVPGPVGKCVELFLEIEGKSPR